MMAKRHPSLTSLSHDHHHGLALSVRLQLGDRALLTDGWTHDPEEQAQRVAAFYDHELSAHFDLEERILFPVIVCHATDSASLVATLIDQHRHLEKLVTRLRSREDGRTKEILLDFGRQLESHIRIEERVLFPAFDQWVPDVVAREVGASLQRGGNAPGMLKPQPVS